MTKKKVSTKNAATLQQSKKEDATALSAELRKKMELLQRSEERYHKMVEEVEDYAILLLDVHGTIQNWNKGAAKIKGYTEAEIVGKNFRVFYLAEDRQRRLPEQLIDEAVRNGKAIHEGWRLRKDGTKFWGSIVITALHDDHGGILGFSKVTRDLTDIKAAGDQIREYARALEFQNKELQQFTYAAAHDLKEPLRKVQFYNSYILEYATERLDEKERSYLDHSIASVERMRKLIDDLLRYSEAASVAEKFESVNLNSIIEEVRLFYQESLPEGSVTLDLCHPAEIWGIPFQIRQLFENLIGNAVKYQDKSRPLQVNISCSSEYRPAGEERAPNTAIPFFKIRVRDNGIGFPSESGIQIFELFHRLHSRVDYPGTGVGLALCKKIVQNHRGLIEAIGRPGEGSDFIVFLPSR
jgi:PAS domain S-box-containing protein